MYGESEDSVGGLGGIYLVGKNINIYIYIYIYISRTVKIIKNKRGA